MRPLHFLLVLLALQAGNAPATPVRIDDDSWRHPVHRPLPIIDGQRSLTPVLRTPSPGISITEGDDWSLPAWSQPLDDRRFYSEESTSSDHVNVHVIDISWRQINPSPGIFSMTDTGSAAGMNFPSLHDQLAQGGPYWLRIWVTGEDWAPTWVKSDCGITTTWLDHDGQARHLPIWNDCVWGHAKAMFRQVLRTWNLAADPDMQFLQVPGGFYYTEFDFDIPFQAAASGDLDFATFDNWFHQAMADLAAIANGENNDPADDYAWKLVYTGEDYPFDDTWSGATNLFARDAVLAGMGIRNGITELFNFHLNHTPAYGAAIAEDGHIVIDEDWPLLRDKRIIGAENECYNACGYHVSDLYYSIRMSNLKALQMRTKRLYVVPQDSYLSSYPEHWTWVRHELGKQRENAPDAWVALRTAQDKYWIDDTSHTWNGAPWIHNLERWLVQNDVGSDGMTRKGTDHRVNEVDADNGESWEGRRTDHASGQDYFYFFVDDVFANDPGQQWQLKVTYVDTGNSSWRVEYTSGSSLIESDPVPRTNSGLVKTATIDLPGARFDNGLPNSADFRIYNGGSDDLEIRFVRLIRRHPPAAQVVFADGFESP
ncbi:hypothetical protein [Thiolapillus brandeum]|uniref:Uncharacterized protein n=1 Tax=Thiolapillus brandeum TaxID=1076588 RepID=A0A7U6JI37_9GAMM|nr:hypothetical protein [Thiolapillus brandeum]BAO45129.1 conserved hypothetical protein [Thiolapillus brandeum]